MKLTIVIPVHNEEGNVGPLYDQVRAVVQPLAIPAEILFVDDGSTDGTAAALRALPGASFLRFRCRRGKSAAYAAGFAVADGDVIITMDGDLQDDPRDIPALLAALKAGADLANGAKPGKGAAGKTLTSRIFNTVVSLLSGLKLRDINCPFKAYRKEVVRELELYGELFRFIPLLAHLKGFRIAEVPVANRPRGAGRSKFGAGRLLHGLFDLLTVLFLYQYRFRPLHLFGGLGLLVGGIGMAINTGLTIRFLISDPHGIGDHKPLLMGGILLTIVGVQLVSTGLLGELVARSQGAGRPEYEIVETSRRAPG